MWYHKKFFKYATAILLILAITFLANSVAFLFSPLFEFIAILLLPVLLATIFYYLMRPIVTKLEKIFFSKSLAILFTFAIFMGLIALIFLYAIPIIIEQITVLVSPPKIAAVKETTHTLLQTPILQDTLRSYLYNINEWISNNLVTTITSITKYTALILATPFILFYFLKEDRSFYLGIERLLPESYSEEIKIVLRDIDTVLSNFIVGQALLSLTMAVILFLGYSAIGLDHALILAILASIFFTIPIIGSFFSMFPALVVGLSISTYMGLKVLLLMLAAWFLEANVISPQIMAQRLHIHPVILILALLAAGSLYGILGLFLVTPVMAIIKILISDLTEIYEKQKIEAKE